MGIGVIFLVTFQFFLDNPQDPRLEVGFGFFHDLLGIESSFQIIHWNNVVSITTTKYDFLLVRQLQPG